MIPYLVRKKARIVYDFMLSKSKQCLLPCHNCSRTCSDLMLNKNTKTYGALTSLCRYKVSNNLSCMYFFLSSNRFYLLFRDIVHEIFSHIFATTVLFRGCPGLNRFLAQKFSLINTTFLQLRYKLEWKQLFEDPFQRLKPYLHKFALTEESLCPNIEQNCPGQTKASKIFIGLNFSSPLNIICFIVCFRIQC